MKYVITVEITIDPDEYDPPVDSESDARAAVLDVLEGREALEPEQYEITSVEVSG